MLAIPTIQSVDAEGIIQARFIESMSEQDFETSLGLIGAGPERHTHTTWPVPSTLLVRAVDEAWGTEC